jgi:hypothetical protein
MRALLLRSLTMSAGLAASLALGACSSQNTSDPPPEGASCGDATVGPPLLRRLTNRELENTLGDIFPGIKAGWQGVKLGVDPVSKAGFGNDAAVLQVSQQTAQEILDTAEEVAGLVTQSAQLAQLLPCAATKPDRSCADTFVTNYGKRLFRRPLSASEKTDYLSLFDEVLAKSTFPTAIKWTLVSLIQSPSAMYRSEIGSPEGDLRKLTPYEIATELAYNYSGSTPSAQLLDKAERGELSSPEVLKAEAQVLLASPRGQAVVQQLFRYWFRYERAASVTRPDVANYFTVRTSLVQETQRFLDQVMLTERGGIKSLLTADYTFIDKTLATHYGFGSADSGFVRVTRPPQWGVGLLAQGAVLAANAQAQNSSPTQRGLLVFEKLLCHHRPDPPPNIPALPAPMMGTTTTRDRYEKQHVADSCRYCHKQFDPIGFMFEHFDEVGRYRADERGLPINDSGRVLTPLDDVLFEAQGLSGLAQTLAARDDVRSCAADMMAIYTFGISENLPSCLIQKVRPDLASNETAFVDYLVQLAASAHMTTRK